MLRTLSIATAAAALSFVAAPALAYTVPYYGTAQLTLFGHYGLHATGNAVQAVGTSNETFLLPISDQNPAYGDFARDPVTGAITGPGDAQGAVIASFGGGIASATVEIRDLRAYTEFGYIIGAIYQNNQLVRAAVPLFDFAVDISGKSFVQVETLLSHGVAINYDPAFGPANTPAGYYQIGNTTGTAPLPAPEPAAIALLGMGVLGFALARRRAA